MIALIPLVSSKVQAGFPSPADDYIESRIDLNNVMIKRPAATFVRTMPDKSLTGYGIYKGDYLVVDCSAMAKQNSLVITTVDGSEIIGWLRHQNRQITIATDDQVHLLSELTVEGVVTWVIRRL